MFSATSRMSLPPQNLPDAIENLADATLRQSTLLCRTSLEQISQLDRCAADIIPCLLCFMKNHCQHCATTIIIMKYDGSVLHIPPITDEEFDKLCSTERMKIQAKFPEIPPSIFKTFLAAQIAENKGNFRGARDAYKECCCLGINCWIKYGRMCQKLTDNPQGDDKHVFEARIAFLIGCEVFGNKSAKIELLRTLLQQKEPCLTMGKLLLYDVIETIRVIDEWLETNQASVVIHLRALMEAHIAYVREHLHDAYPKIVLAAGFPKPFVCAESDHN